MTSYCPILEREFHRSKQLLTMLLLSIALNGASGLFILGGDENYRLALITLSPALALLAHAAYLIGGEIKEIAKFSCRKNSLKGLL